MTLLQIGAILAILAAFGVNQPTIDKVQAILEPAPVQTNVPESTLQVAPKLFGSITFPQSCVENPQLIVKATRTTSQDMTLLQADYTTGCKIDTSLPYSFKIIDTDKNTTIEQDSETLVQTPYPDGYKWHFEYHQVYHPMHLEMIFTVGGLMATTTVI